jgi:glycosyltransferase involved in cell wall biosynthesis
LLRDDFGLEGITTIHNPIDITRARQRAKEDLPQKHKPFFKDSFVFINIGRLTHQKGQTHLIRAFSQVAEHNSSARLAILGEGGLRDRLEKLITDCDLESRVQLFGNQERVFSFLKVADQFVFSSLWEGFGNVILESLAVDTPVISTDCLAGPREILTPELSVKEDISYPYKGKCGSLVEPFTVDHIFASPKEKDLTPPEQMLADEMNSSMDKKQKKIKVECVQRFAQDKIINQWRQLLF